MDLSITPVSDNTHTEEKRAAGAAVATCRKCQAEQSAAVLFWHLWLPCYRQELIKQSEWCRSRKSCCSCVTFWCFPSVDGVTGVGSAPPLPGPTGDDINYVYLYGSRSCVHPVRSECAGAGDESRPLPMSWGMKAASVISEKSPAGDEGLFSDLSGFSGRLLCRLLCSLLWSA